MNKNIFKYLLALGAAGFMVGCETDYYNEEYLDGWKPGCEPVDIQTVKYTLEDGDYKAVAGNKANMALAEQKGVLDELKALSKNKCFSKALPAQDYLPAFLNDRYNYYLSDGSRALVTYNVLNEELSENMKGVMAASEYKISKDDYKSVWGEEITADYFTPGKSAEIYIPGILKKSIKDPVKGDFVITEYAFSATEPSTGNGGGDEPGGETEETYAQIGSLLKGQTVAVKGTVSAAYQRGFILDDGTGAVLVYLDKQPSNFSLGDIVEVKGEVGEYNNGLQFMKPEMKLVGKTADFKFPAAKTMTKADFEAFGASPKTQYVTFNGTFSAEDSGKGFFYYNVDVDGAGISLSYVYPGQIDHALNGQKVTVTGYAFAYKTDRNSTYVMPTSVVAVGQQPATTPIGIVASASAEGDASIIGQIAAMDFASFVVNDGTGSVLCYYNERPAYKVGDVLKVTGHFAPYGGFMQFKNAETTLMDDKQNFTQPDPVALTAEQIDLLPEVHTLQYITLTGNVIKGYKDRPELELVGTNIFSSVSLKADDALGLTADLIGQQITIKGYLVGVSVEHKNITVVVSEFAPAGATAMVKAARGEKRYGIFSFNGASWDVAKDCLAVNPKDYEQMGSEHGSFSGSFAPDSYLPQFLGMKFPYAQEGDVKVVAYLFYDKSQEKNVTRADEYTRTGNVWTKTEKTSTFEGPFKKISGAWKFDPSMTIVLDPAGNEFTVNFMQTAVDWVFANIDPAKYKGKYDNTEYYAGYSSHYKNISWKIFDILKYWGGEDKAAEDISAYADYESADEGKRRAAFEAFYKEIEKRTAEVTAGTLNQLYSDVKMIDGLDVIYTIQAKIFAPPVVDISVSVPTHEFKFKLVGDGRFEYIEGSFKALDPAYELMSAENFPKYQHQ